VEAAAFSVWRMAAFAHAWNAWGTGSGPWRAFNPRHEEPAVQRTPDRLDRQMKKAAVPTTAAKGAAVSNRRRTADQSVYIPAMEALSHHPSPRVVVRRSRCNESFHSPREWNPGE
jgi:hypothetical protein